MVKSEKYIAGSEKNEVYRLLDSIILKDDRFLRKRLCGEMTSVSNDLFFLVHNDTEGLSRIWMGYGKHENAVGNWGAVFTPEAHRGKGYCAKNLAYCFEELESMDNAPTALFCTAGTPALTDLYQKYGFTTALKGRNCGPLYRPMGNSPKTFQDFCRNYYTETDELFVVNADFGWRNEIDCLLRFALTDIGENFGIKGIFDLWPVIMEEPDRAKVVLTKENKCAGWMIDGEMQLYPIYRQIEKITYGNHA